MKHYLFITTIITVLFLTSMVSATDYQVSSASEIKTAMISAQPGDTLTMTNGVWTDQKILFQGSGTEAAPILLRAETPGYVILNGTSTLRIAGDYLVVDGLQFVGGYSSSGGVIEFRNGGLHSNYCRLTNTSIVDYNPSSISDDYKWVSIYGTYNRVDHCYFEGKTHSGTTLVVWLDGRKNYHRIDHNYFGYRPPLGFNGGETIRVGTSDWSLTDSYTTVEYNYFERCNGETEIISSKSCENIYRYNTFVECEGVLTLRHGNRCSVYGNFFFGNQKGNTGGVRIIGEDHKVYNNYFESLYGSGYKSALVMMNGVPNSPLNRYYQVKNALVAFNTFVDCRYTFYLGAGANSELSLPPLNCTIANNAVQTTHQLVRLSDDPVNLTWQGNIMQGSSLGIDQPEGIVLTDPMLFLADDTLWRPAEGSPLIGAAVGEYADVIDDMDGHERSAVKDVGADQVSSEPVVRRPMTPADAGPAWDVNALPMMLTLRKTGSGQVTVDPPGGIYDAGTIVTLTATPDSGWRFESWDGDMITSDNPLQVVMDQHVTLRANFVEDKPAEYTLNVLVFSGGGSVEIDPPGGVYPESTIVTLTAIPFDGWKFNRWDGGLSSINNPDSLMITADIIVLGVFEQQTRVVSGLADMPAEFQLQQNFPNPFNPKTTIRFALPESGFTQLVVYNTLGHHIATLVNEHMDAGFHQIAFDAANLPSGVYFYRLSSNQQTELKKMILLE